MLAGRHKNLDTKMKGTINNEGKMCDMFLPRKCDYTDRVISSKDHSSIHLSVCDVTIPSPSSTPTAPSTSPNHQSSQFQATSDPQEKETLQFKKSLPKKNSFDRTSIYLMYFIIVVKKNILSIIALPVEFGRIIAQEVIHALLRSHHRVPELRLVVHLSTSIKKYVLFDCSAS